MPPLLALLIWALLLLALLRFDPAKEKETSSALWVPLLWMFIVATRLPSQWFGDQTVASAAAIEEGNPLDRTILLVLILLAIAILIARSFNWGDFIANNSVLMLFLIYALVSFVWSDFPLVTFKRWFRDLGNYLVILVVLSDSHQLEAVRTFLRRLFYLLLPLSTLLNKYFPNLSKQYDNWTGQAMFVGATTSKNMLGVLCLVSGIFFLWDTVTRWPDRKERKTKRIILVNVVFFMMTVQQLSLAASATSQVCLVIGCLVVVVVNCKWGRRHQTFLKIMTPACFVLYVIVGFGFGLNGEFARQVGRNPTLTGRTDIWDTVLGMHTNPVIGTGYESFWLGPRLLYVWQKTIVGLNEAHNGYLEVYLSLGLIGVFLLCAFMMATYRTIWKRLSLASSLGSFGLAVWTVVLFYNMTEAAAFKGHLMWITFLLLVIVVSSRTPTSSAFSRVKSPLDKRLPSQVKEGVVT